MRSPLTITYRDLIKYHENLLRFMEKDYPGRVMLGTMSEQTKNKRIECQRTTLRLFKAQERNRQLTLNEAFDKIK